MTPATKQISKRYKGVGRIAVRSGTNDLKVFTEIMVALDWLSQKPGGIEVLRLVQNGTIHPLEVREAFMLGDLDRLPTAGGIRKFKPAMNRWLKDVDLAASTVDVYRWHLETLIGDGNPRVADLPKLLERYRRECKKAGHSRKFNHTRAAALSFLRYTIKTGRHSPLWIDVASINPLKQIRTEKPHYTPEFCRAVASDLKRNGGMFWAMCITGMNPSEYWGRWTVGDDRIRIYGTKRAGRLRVVPLLWVPVKPHITREGFKTAIGKLRDRGVSAKSGRDAFAQWMEAAGIPRTRRKMYLGHGVADVQDLYERHELDAYLAADAERLRTHIGEPFQQIAVMR